MTRKILLADDSVTIQKVVELTFSDGSYEVVCTASGSDVQRLVEETDPDIALLDVVMPGGNGYELCNAIKSNPDTAWTPVVLLAGTFEPYDEKRASSSGADAHMKKPFESKALRTEVDRLLAAHPRPGEEDKGRERVVPVVSSPDSTPSSGRAPEKQEVEIEGDSPGFVAVEVEPEPDPTPGPSPAPKAEAPTRTPPIEASEAATGDDGARSDELRKSARDAVDQIAERIVREIAWEIIPDLTEAIVRKRIRELEEEVERQAQS